MRKKNNWGRILCITLSVIVLAGSLSACSSPEGKDGAPGKDGLSPFIGANGNWWIGNNDTGIQAEGKDGANGKDGTDGKDGIDGLSGKDGVNGKDGIDGITPHIGANGNWYIGDTDTGIKASGINGKDGASPMIGSNGNWWIGIEDTGVRASAQDGKSVTFRVKNNWLQWRYTTDSEWKNLYEITMPDPPETGAKITFKLEGGILPEGTADEIVVTPGTSVVLPTPTYAGYTFGGWYRAGGSYPVSSPYRVHDNAVLYAKWLPGTTVIGTPIYTLDDLANISNDLDGTYVLMNDLDCMGLAIPTIGATDADPFRGIFDGNGYTISNLKASPSTSAGLFGYNSGTIQNLQMENCSMTLTTGAYLGIIAGVNKGTIEQCAVIDCSVSLTGNNNVYSGLICGSNSGKINNCFASGTVSGKCTNVDYYAYTGGLTGKNNTSISNCFIHAIVTSHASFSYLNASYAGGIAASNSSGKIENCIVLGTIQAKHDYKCSAGDITASNNSNVVNCYKDENLSVSAYGIYASATPMSKDSLSNESFYKVSLKWDSDIWDWSNIDIANGKNPRLKVIR